MDMLSARIGQPVHLNAMSPESAQPRTRRADAKRNRETILRCARDAFTELGTHASMAEVARRAGVGMATLYRNFPGRRELLEALYVDEVDTVCRAAAETDDALPGAAFTAWLRRFAGFLASKHDVAMELLAQTDRDNPIFDSGRDRVVASARPLFAAAQESGEIRAELTLEQVLDMVLAVSAIQGEPAYKAPILEAALDGIRRST